MYMADELKKRAVPALLALNGGGRAADSAGWEKRRLEILEILRREEYGNTPEGPFGVTSEALTPETDDCAGKALSQRIKLKVKFNGGEFAFPVYRCVPKLSGGAKCPVIVHIAFSDAAPDKYMPVEEIIDRGAAVLMFYYNDITEDRDDGFSTGIAAMYGRSEYGWGKIAMWAWAASRVMDYLAGQPSFDLEKTAVAGHSRLGKTALWCGANDPRFKYIFANNSGCSGDAVTRGKTGEHVKEITKNFSYWFCEKYRDYVGREDMMPFDQHFLLAASAPRVVCCGAAIEDTWADPYSQYLSCCAASEAYELLGKDGLVARDGMPDEGDTFGEGNICYHLRSGRHFFSRYDWNRYIDRLLK